MVPNPWLFFYPNIPLLSTIPNLLHAFSVHDHLNSILAEALGVAQMTEEIFTGQIDHIGMCEPGKLIIYKKNGSTIPCSYDLLLMEKRQKPYRPRKRKGDAICQS